MPPWGDRETSVFSWHFIYLPITDHLIPSKMGPAAACQWVWGNDDVLWSTKKGAPTDTICISHSLSLYVVLCDCYRFSNGNQYRIVASTCSHIFTEFHESEEVKMFSDQGQTHHPLVCPTDRSNINEIFYMIAHRFSHFFLVNHSFPAGIQHTLTWSWVHLLVGTYLSQLLLEKSRARFKSPSRLFSESVVAVEATQRNLRKVLNITLHSYWSCGHFYSRLNFSLISDCLHKWDSRF